MVRVLVKRPGDDGFVAPEISSYGDEAQLQRLIAGTPEVLPGIDGGPPVVTMREFPLRFGRADVVVVDLEGAILLCECKLRTNPQARREVIGQLVSYAGALSKMSYDEFAQVASTRLALSGARRVGPGRGGARRRRLSSGSWPPTWRNVVIVAAKHAYDECRRRNAYICQPESTALPDKTRTFRPEIRLLGFYRNKQIEREVPRMVGRYASVLFTADEADRRKASSDPADQRLGS